MTGRGAFRRPAKAFPRGALEAAEERMQAQVATRRVRSPSAGSLRSPWQWQSSTGKSAPKARPEGVADGNPVHIPEPSMFLRGDA